jgi:hypothetical protein
VTEVGWQAIQGAAFAALGNKTALLDQFIQPALQRSSGNAISQNRLNHLDTRAVWPRADRVQDRLVLGG